MCLYSERNIVMSSRLSKSLLLLICLQVCTGKTRIRDSDDAVLTAKRFIFDSSDRFTGWASWEQYAACTTQCVSGYEQQTKECCDTGNNLICYKIPWDKLKSQIGTCPVDGHFGVWSYWTDCSRSCGGGLKYRQRSCLFATVTPRGKNCTGDFIEDQPCNQELCPVDGVLGSWSTWTACSMSCGGGNQFRTRICFFDSLAPKGMNCTGSLSQSQSCNTLQCPVDGVWGSWTPWSACTVTCGAGQRNRRRECFFQPHVPRGDFCQGKSSEIGVCNSISCPVDGVWQTWSAWSKCSVTCGSGQRNRRRHCFFQPHVPQGDFCRGSSTQSESCNDQSCPAPVAPRECFQCIGPPVICEKLNSPQTCPLDKQYCINTLNNYRNASRTVDMRCGTRDECRNEWFLKYSSDDTCVQFSQDYVYTNDFHCEFCCDTDLCNEKINPDTKWHP